MTKEHFRKIYSLFPEPLKGLLLRFEDALIYIFYGVLTTMVNYAVHFWLRLMFATDKDWNSIREMMDAMETSAMPSAAAAAVAWAAAVAFAFYTNKYFVFEKKTKEGIWAELVGFAGGRLLSLAIEMGIMFIFVDELGMNELIVKLAAGVVVLIINYFLSKLIIFRKRDEK